MIDAAILDNECFETTDGEIAIVNLNSARLRSWSRFDLDPQRPGVAEAVLEHEQLTAQFVGDLSALDRMETLAEQLVQLDSSSARAALIQAQVASALHRFSDARHYLAQASLVGAPSADVKRISLNVDQACGKDLDAVLDERRRIVAKTGRVEDRVALGGLLADLGEYGEADEIYRQALRQYQDVSPFPVAWICFQLGALWGELVPEPQSVRAEQWYRKAIACLPCYVKARSLTPRVWLRAATWRGLLRSARASISARCTRSRLGWLARVSGSAATRPTQGWTFIENAPGYPVTAKRFQLNPHAVRGINRKSRPSPPRPRLGVTPPKPPIFFPPGTADIALRGNCVICGFR
jgi:tetratricopeptide (TPR) repeat protein